MCNRLYVLDAQQPSNSSKPLVFDPTGKCPAFVVNPEIARPAREKQNADEVEYAQLVEANVSVAPIHSGFDGGMNKVFLAQFPVSILLARAPGSQLSELPPVPGPTMMVRWRVNCLASRSNRSPPLGGKSPRPISATREGGADFIDNWIDCRAGEAGAAAGGRRGRAADSRRRHRERPTDRTRQLL